MNEMLQNAILFGLAAAGTAQIVHALPWKQKWKKRKPLACALCLSVWSALAVTAARFLAGSLDWSTHTAFLHWGLTYLGNVAVSVLVLKRTVDFGVTEADLAVALGIPLEHHDHHEHHSGDEQTPAETPHAKKRRR